MRSPILIEPHIRWLACVVNAAFLYILAPVAFWAAFCISAGRLDVGVVLAVLAGFAGTYFIFGVSLLLTCLGATAAVSTFGTFSRGWQRSLFGIIVGAVAGALMGGYMAFKLAREAAAISEPTKPFDSELVFMSLGAGAALGVALPTLWHLSISAARRVWGTDAEPAAPPNGGPAESLGNSEAGGGPPSVA
ncbi:MAG TPA: hypothetical protein VJA21_31585 [Verrucomicrobiae bacterium]